ncbi:MAG: asparagine synthase (glutamine-hydrolyzing) [Nitrospirae bacterium]|nr:asparagine synthase (glutamine-hydrolyzing) [Nitrospirota bacterium]
MCGILGIVYRNSKVDAGQFSQMLDTLQSRGPDQKGVFFRENIALGHRRLSIIDLSENGRQPLFNEDGTICIVFNGEIYNYKDVKGRLKHEHKWISKTDTEVLVHGYEEIKQDIISELEGMFALAVYDSNTNTITMARDHFGKKPLYYYLDNECFCFASELKAITKNAAVKSYLQVDRLSMIKYLFYGYIPSPHSAFDKIKKLEPATTVQFDIANWEIVNKKRYWKLEDIRLDYSAKEAEILEVAEDLIIKAVKKRLMSDVPVGVFLSGGVDSSLITVYLSLLGQHLEVFNVRYKDYPEVDESVYAEKVSKMFDLKYNLCDFNINAIRESYIDILNYLDEPIADIAIVPLYYLAKFAKDRIKVVLSGDGGDEIFGGYSKYIVQSYIEKLRFLSFMSGFRRVVSKNSAYYKLFSCFGSSFAERQFIFGSGSFLNDEVGKLLKVDDYTMDSVFEESIDYEMLFKQRDIINKSLYMDCKIQLPDWYLVKGDRTTMANSIEMRNPFLDKTLVEYAFSIPGKWKTRLGHSKYILKKLAAKYVDRKIIYRKKSGFGFPLNNLLKTTLKDLYKEYLFLPDDRNFNGKYVRQLYNQHVSGEVNNEYKLLRIFNYNYWSAHNT